jgi:hypothetical protein
VFSTPLVAVRVAAKPPGFFGAIVTVAFAVLTHHNKAKQPKRGCPTQQKHNKTSAFRPMKPHGNGPSRGKGGAPKILQVSKAFGQQKLVVTKDGSLAVAALPEEPVPVLPPLVAVPAPEPPAETEPELQARMAMWRARGECALPSCFRPRACA